MELQSIEPITWKTPRRRPFPCFTGCGNEATKRVSFHTGIATVNLCLCDDCTELACAGLLEPRSFLPNLANGGRPLHKLKMPSAVYALSKGLGL